MNPAQRAEADRTALARALAVVPVWRGMTTAREAVGLAEDGLLHAGPAFDRPDEIAGPILNSAAVAAVFEGLAGDFEEARARIGRGEIALGPAQDRGIVLPLASVLSASMALHVVADAGAPAQRAYAPINGGAGPALRLGLCSQAVLAHARWLNGPFAELLSKASARDLDLIEIARLGLGQGDDLHGRTPAATAALAARLGPAFGTSPGAEEARGFLREGPSFFLNLWMGACKCILAAGAGVPGASLVTAAGGNGLRIGLQVAGLPGAWFTAPAAPPVGDLGGRPAARALGAIGDSALVDLLGFGAMAMSYAPAQEAALGRFLPAGGLALPGLLLARVHPGFAALGLRTGLCAGRVVETGRSPVISLGILDRRGEAGRLGGGIFEMPQAPFRAALAALAGAP